MSSFDGGASAILTHVFCLTESHPHDSPNIDMFLKVQGRSYGYRRVAGWLEQENREEEGRIKSSMRESVYDSQMGQPRATHVDSSIPSVRYRSEGIDATFTRGQK